MISAEDIKRSSLVKFQRLNGRASGVVDTIGGETLLVQVFHGTLNASGAKARLYESDTVSGTASGMTLVASAGTTLAASATSWAYILHKPKRFVGLVLSGAGTASAATYPTMGAEAILFDNKLVPVSSTLGFTSVTRDPSGS
jgi:hypothetical protein